jgi:hypothetical protein
VVFTEISQKEWKIAAMLALGDLLGHPATANG